MAREAAVGTVALVSNMTGHTCPECGHVSELFTGDGAKRLTEESGLPVWAEIPFDPRLGASTDSGTPLVINGPRRPIEPSDSRFGRSCRGACRNPGRDQRGGLMKFLCLDCDDVMVFAERQIPGDGTLAAVFTCGSCGREMAMLTNPMETQLVSSMGVKIGGREVPTQPMELARTSLEGGREGAFALSEDIPLASGEAAIGGEGANATAGRVVWTAEAASRSRASSQLRPRHGEADLRRLGTGEGRLGDHARHDGPGSHGVGPGRDVGLFGAAELSFTYPSGRRGLGGVSLGGEPGDRVVVMGPNGSGKSTLLRLVSTELISSPGSLTLFDEVSQHPSRDVRRKIGIVQDTPVHVDDLTGMENGLLFAELYGLPRDASVGALEGSSSLP